LGKRILAIFLPDHFFSILLSFDDPSQFGSGSLFQKRHRKSLANVLGFDKSQYFRPVELRRLLNNTTIRVTLRVGIDGIDFGADAEQPSKRRQRKFLWRDFALDSGLNDGRFFGTIFVASHLRF
jgi:hypothetical protein